MGIVLLLVGLGIIFLAAELFTNAIEWFGKHLRLNEGAVGSVFAAVGTALPETMVPVIAVGFWAVWGDRLFCSLRGGVGCVIVIQK